MAVVVLIGAAAGSPDASAAAPAPDGPRLAFTVMAELRPERFSLGTVNPDGSGRVVVLRGSKRGLYPVPFSGVSWSPDGWLYFAGRDGRRSGIYKVRADGTGLRFLRGTEEGRNPVVSPDGRKLAFTRQTWRGRSFHSTGTAIWVGDGDGHGASRLRQFGLETEVVPSSFAPDNSKLAVTLSGTHGKTKVSLVRLDRGGRIRLLAKRASEAAFSPDGSKIALVRHTMSTRGPRFTIDRDLYVISPDGSKSAPVTNTTHVAETQPSWDPLGQRIAFNAYHNSKDAFDALFDELLPLNNSIVEINADGTCRRKILKLPGSILRGGAWQPGLDRAPGPVVCRRSGV